MNADRIIVAIDTDVKDDALQLATSLRGHASWLKIGMTLFYTVGPEIVDRIRDLGFSVFVDLKLHDIPNQVRAAARTLSSRGAEMITVHALGGEEMMRAAVVGAHEGADHAGKSAPKVLAVTVLTSMDAAALGSVGVERSAVEEVRILAELAKRAGVDGVVCSPQEAAEMRGLLGSSALVVTPGVRPAGSAAGDQRRISTPADALSAGASHLVIGRPITEAPIPAEAFDEIVRSL